MRAGFLYPLIFIMLIVLPVFLINQDLILGESIEKDDAARRTREKAQNLLDEIGRSASDQIQVRRLVHQFHEEVFPLVLKERRDKAKKIIEGVYAGTLAKTLPPHDLVLNYWDVFRGRSETLFKVSSGLGLPEGPVESFSQAILQDRLPYDPGWNLVKKMREITHFPLSKANFSHDYSTRYEQFQSGEGRRVLYFELYPNQYRSPFEIRGLTTFLMDSEKIPPYFGPKTLVDSWKEDDIGVAILPSRRGKPMFSKFFVRYPELRELIYQVRDKHRSVSVEDAGEHLLYFGKPNLTLEFQPVVVFPIPVSSPPGAFSATRLFQLGAQLLVLVGGLLTLFLVFSGRIIRLSVSMVLLGAFFLVGILPMSGVSSISRFALAEKEQRSRQDLAQKLHQKLISLDTDVYFKQSLFVQLVRKVTRKYEAEEILYKEECAGTDSRSLGSMTTGIFQNQDIFIGTALTGFLIVAGPGEFKRIWTPSLATEERGQARDAFHLLSPIAKASLKHFQKRLKRPGEGSDESIISATDQKPSKLEIEYEMIRDIFIAGIGGEILTNLLHFPYVINDIKINMSRVFLMMVPYFYRSFPRYSCLWAWDEEILRNTTESDFNIGKRKEEGFRLYCVNSTEGKLTSSPPDLADTPELFNLSERSSLLRLPFRSWVDAASGPSAIESIPSSFFNNRLFAGMLQGSDPSGELKRAFRITIAIGALLAIGLAVFGTFFFMAPLRRILGGLQKVSQGILDVKMKDAARQDEFGTLANAFNTMVAGLREKALLSRFVSSSVQRAVADSGFQASAKEGEVREATILFSGIHGFEEYKGSHSPQEVFELLENHLAAMNEAVGKFGGEINKVMGEKILVIFDHQQLGGGENAIAVTMDVIWEVKTLLGKTTEIQPVMGINSGSVIAGIIGSPNVRLDYTVIGDTVNLASRLSLLAHITGGTQIVLSGGSVRFLRNTERVEKLPFNRVKGKTREVEAFLLLAPDQ